MKTHYFQETIASMANVMVMFYSIWRFIKFFQVLTKGMQVDKIETVIANLDQIVPSQNINAQISQRTN